MTQLRYWLVGALSLVSCQPDVLCDRGYHAIAGGCYRDAVAADGGQDAAPAGDAGGECPGDRYDGFKASCERSAQCGCHAPECAPVPLGYCTRFNCDPAVTEDCPPGWTCLMIPPGASPDPTITHLCLAP